MKKILKKPLPFYLIICLLLFLSSVIMAQTKEPLIKKIYLQGAAGSNTIDGGHGEIGLQTVFNNKWSATISYHSLSMDPKNLPSDYQPGSGVIFFLIPYTDEVNLDMELYSLTAGRYFQTGKKSWITTEAGISVVKGQTASFQKTGATTIDGIAILFGMAGTTSNYTATLENKSSIGCMIRADYNWAFSRFFGLGAGVFANFNSIQSPVGFNMKLTMGWMRPKTKK